MAPVGQPRRRVAVDSEISDRIDRVHGADGGSRYAVFGRTGWPSVAIRATATPVPFRNSECGGLARAAALRDATEDCSRVSANELRCSRGLHGRRRLERGTTNPPHFCGGFVVWRPNVKALAVEFENRWRSRARVHTKQLYVGVRDVSSRLHALSSPHESPACCLGVSPFRTTMALTVARALARART